MAIAWLLVVLGIVGLVFSADRFVAGSAALARNFGISKMVIGLTVVSLGTSAPEIFASLDATLQGFGIMAVGNAIGSNIVNIGLVLSITAIVVAIPIRRHLLSQEIPALLGITAMAGLFLFDGQFRPWEGAVLLVSTIPLIYLMYRVKRAHPEDVDEEEIPRLATPVACFWFVIGLVLLAVSARLLVNGADTIAKSFGLSELVIGLTVVAIGTSLPELAASLVSARKGHHDIALGNIIGSNIFNFIIVMSIPALAGTTTLEPAVFLRDYGGVVVLTLVLVLAMVFEFVRDGGTSRFPHTKPQIKQSGPKLGRLVGVLLLLCYVGYSVILFHANQTA